MFVGVTLLFVDSCSSGMEGWLKSYIVQAKNQSELEGEAYVKAQEEIRNAEEGHQLSYYGIEDVFKVSGPFQQYTIVGSYSGPDDPTQVMELIGTSQDWQVSKKPNEVNPNEWCIAKGVFLIDDGNGLVVRVYNVVCTAGEIGEPLDRWMEAGDFIAPYDNFASLRSVNFVGYEDIVRVKKNPLTGSAFEWTYKPIASIEEVADLAPDFEKIEGFWQTVDENLA